MKNRDLVYAIDDAMVAHNAMRRTLIFAINLNNQEKTPEEIGSDDHCAFGHWLHGHSLDAETKTHKPFQVVDRLHREFHRTAGEVATLARDGQRDEALALIDGEYAERSDTLMRALKKWRGEQVM